MEIWKDIEGYEGLYQISSYGRVKNNNGKILKLSNDGNNYYFVKLSKNNKPKNYKIHRLVAQHFIPNPDNKPCIDHINTDRTDNRVENLRWVTYKENCNNNLTKTKMSGKYSQLNPHSKKLLQFDKSMNFIKKWNCVMDAHRELDFNNSYISTCCRNKCDSAYGYIWQYADEYEKVKFKVFDLEIYRKKAV